MTTGTPWIPNETAIWSTGSVNDLEVAWNELRKLTGWVLHVA